MEGSTYKLLKRQQGAKMNEQEILKNENLNETDSEVNEGNKIIKMLTAKKTFGIMGWGFFTFAIVSIIGQALASIIINIVTGGKIQPLPMFAMLLMTFIPMYIIAFPLLLFIIRKLPKFNETPKNMSVLELIKYFCICITIMYVGNLIGTGLSYLISSIFGRSSNNNLADLIGKADPLSSIVFLVILGPIMEELVFRKILIDRTAKYGERSAMFLSALMFGLFHMNLFQFFYAFGIGLVFSYIYVRTRKIIYSIIFHIVINFLGSVGAMYTAGVFLKVSNAAKVGGVNAILKSIDLSVIVALIYSFIVLAAFIAGLVFIIVGIIFYISGKKIKLDTEGAPFTPKEEKGLVYGNYGMALFIAVCVVMTVFSTIAQMQ